MYVLLPATPYSCPPPLFPRWSSIRFRSNALHSNSNSCPPHHANLYSSTRNIHPPCKYEIRQSIVLSTGHEAFNPVTIQSHPNQTNSKPTTPITQPVPSTNNKHRKTQ
ncbi:hypothetical protein CC78DRAFT_387039 [Lojkania enalia]|uniref:Uncharacterized protein n=1 Tax=Lojkania enalia TaxID=147567 RepID=A0A9P4N6K9_9PLEO|nr:hypothetical protein CC78DRAFT_387039 [Didymosphaeria enalia]